MSSDSDHPIEATRKIGQTTDGAEEVCCVTCILFLSAIAFLGGANFIGINHPEAAIASILMMGIPALCLSLLYVGWQIRKTIMTKE